MSNEFPEDPATTLIKALCLALNFAAMPSQIRYVSDVAQGTPFDTAAYRFQRQFDEDSSEYKALSDLASSETQNLNRFVFEEVLPEDTHALEIWIKNHLKANTNKPKIVATYFAANPNVAPANNRNWIKNMLLAEALEKDDVGIFFMPSFYYCFRRHSLDIELEERGLTVKSVLETPIFSGKGKHIIVVVRRGIGKVKPFLGRLESLRHAEVFLRDWARPMLLTQNELEEITSWVDENLDAIMAEIAIQTDLPPKKPEYPDYDYNSDHRWGWFYLSEFAGFELDSVQTWINREGSFENFDFVPIGEILTSEKYVSVDDDFELNSNEVIWSALGVFDDLPSYQREGWRLKHTFVPNIFLKLELNSQTISRDYFVSYFKSQLGSLQLDASYNDRGYDYGPLPQHIRVHLPLKQATQKKLVDAWAKVDKVRRVFSDLNNQITFFPDRLRESADIIEAVMEPLGELSASEKVRSLINRGEDKKIEFKSTFSLDLKSQTKESRIIESAMKTVVAFLNTQGGDLLIGVEDSGNLLGIEVEIEKFYKGNRDKFLLNFKDHLRQKIGPEFYPLIDHSLVAIDGVTILRVSCKESSKEVFLDNKDFYVRTNPATDRLEGKDLADYIRQRFP